MAAKAATVANLAREAGLSADDVLLALWDRGIEYPVTPQSEVRVHDLSLARSVVGLASMKERLKVSYWEHNLGLTPSELRDWALERGVRIGQNARRLPKGALAKFERASRPVALATGPVGGEHNEAEGSDPLPELPWRIIGHVRDEITHLSAEELEAIHFEIARDFAGSPDPIAPAGVRSRPLLESAAARSSAGMQGFSKYPTVEMAGASLAHSVINNHPFFNGNKRTALVALLSFLDSNGAVLTCSQDEVFKWTLRVSAHRLGAADYRGDQSDNEVMLMSDWLSRNSRSIERGERVVTFATLRRCLQDHGCEVKPTGRRGGSMMITRNVEVEIRGLWGARKKTELRKFQLTYGGDGREVSRRSIKELRHELKLSEEHGVDSRAFYGSDKQSVDVFIAEYRKTLSRLAKL